MAEKELATRYQYKNYSLYNQATEINSITVGVLCRYSKTNFDTPHWWPSDVINIQEAPGSSVGGHIHRPAVRLPPFWPDRPGLWFAQAETPFVLATITSERTKFNNVISQLEYRHAAEVEDIIISPPTDEPYTTLKTELVGSMSSSHDQRVRQLLTHEEMGDCKPSQFLRLLKSLAPDVPDDFLRSIWSSRLPPHIQTILAGQAEGNLDAASQLAGRIAESSTLHDSLGRELLFDSNHPFFNFKNLIVIWLISPKNYPLTYNWMYVCKVDQS